MGRAFWFRPIPPIRTIADLKGKRIGFTKGSSAHNVVIATLEKAGLTYDDITPVYLSPPDAGPAFANGSIEAWAIWDPYFAIGEKRQNGRILINACEVAKTNSFYIANRDFAKNNGGIPRRRSTAWRTGKWAEQHRGEVAKSLAAVTGVPLEIQTVAANRASFVIGPVTDDIVETQQAVADRFYKLGLIPKPIVVRDIVWRSAADLIVRHLHTKGLNMRRFVQRLIASAVLSIGIVAAAVGTSYGQDKVVRIGYQKYGKLVLLKSKGTLEPKLAADGYKVVWTEFPSGPPLLEALNVGAIDFGNTGEAPPIFAQAAGAPIQYVAYEPPAPKGEAILVPKDSPLNSVADLKGKKVALNKGSNVHYLLVKALEKAGVKYSEIEPVFLAPADARAAFERGAVDAWVIWDPFQAAAEAATGARTLADGTGIVANYQFYFASKKFLDANPKIVDAVLAELERGRRLGQGRHPRRCRAAGAGDRPVGPGGRGGAEAAVLRHQADHRCRHRRSAAGCGCVLRAQPDPKHQDFRRGPEARIMSNANVQRQHPLVPADPWRRPLSRHRHRRP